MDSIFMIALLHRSVSQTENTKYKDFIVIDIKASQVQPRCYTAKICAAASLEIMEEFQVLEMGAILALLYF